MQKIFIVVIVVLAIGMGVWYAISNRRPADVPLPGDVVACTEEAKMCPDGSSVARTGPQCAFAACPFTAVDRTDWQQSAMGLPFQLQFPATWKSTSEIMNEGLLMQETYTGEQGTVVVTYGTGLGGACDNSRTYVRLADQEIVACEGTQPDGTYVLSQMSGELTALDGSKQGFSIAATIPSPKDQHFDTVLTVLSTIKMN
jgi:hypothetical protein